MKQIEFSFEQTPWERTFQTLLPGQSFSAARFLTLLEEEDEDYVEAALEDLEEKRILLDISDLPKPALTGEAAEKLRREVQFVKNGLLLENLDPTDPLRVYLEEVAATPSAGDPAILAEQCALGHAWAKDRLTNVMLSRVIALAGEMTDRGILLLDLIQEGSLGLWQAINQYQEGDFQQQCDWWIRNYLAKAVVLQARNNGIGQKLRQGMEDYRDVDQRLLSELGRNPTLEEIAQQLHIQPEEAAVLEAMIATARNIQQVKASREPKEISADDTQAVENTAYFQTRQRILELLSALSEEDAKLLTLRFGLEGGLPLNPQQTGEQLGLSAEEVIARETTALAKLRNDAMENN